MINYQAGEIGAGDVDKTVFFVKVEPGLQKTTLIELY
jgi:hypothetical protein